MITAAAAFFLVLLTSFVPGDVAERPAAGSRAPERALQRLGPGWTELPPPPEVRTSAATGWTGRELLVWGGYVYTGFGADPLRDDGFAFDPGTRTWRKMAASPLGYRALPAAAWTGTELLVWGGWDNNGRYFFEDGAAYDPVSDSWTMLPDAPISARAPLHVWTGEELLVWGTAVRTEVRPRDGAAYDPATRSWRTIAEAPIELTDATAVWTGAEMIVFGAALHGGNQAETDAAIGAAYDPAADTWRRLSDSTLSPQASTAAWNGRALIAWDYANRAAEYDPERDAWTALPPVPLEDYECSPQAVAAGRRFFGDYCGAMVVHDGDGWREVSRPGLAAWGFQLTAAGPVVFLMGSDVDTGREIMLAYRPR